MTKIIHTADVHLTNSNDERWQALVQVLKLAKKEKADVVTISGDLFDTDFSATKYRAQLRSLFSNNGFPIIIIPGNHDQKSFSQNTFFGDEANILDKSKTKFSLEKTDIYGLPFEPLSSDQIFQKINELNQELDLEKTNVLLFHGELLDQFFCEDDFGQEGNRRYMPLKLNFFAETNFDYVLAGHFHRSFTLQPLPNSRLKNGGWFVYPGSPISVTKKELGQRSVAIIKTGQKPQEKTIASNYYQQLDFRFTPGEEKKQLKLLEKEVKKAEKNCKILLVATGYIDGSNGEFNSTILNNELKKLAKKYSVIEVDNQVVDIESIFNDALFKTFKKKLAKFTNKREEQQLEQTLINAMMEFQGK
ncbi:MAG: DNA repair exonuclease [Patescibacteria group bacterium]|nr:DNA repair exonuclease [Patescibacteria group bacterium]